MASNDDTVTIQELVNLVNVGVPERCVTWGRVTMTSDLCICARFKDKHKDETYEKAHIFEIQKEGLPVTQALTQVDSAQVCPLLDKDKGPLRVAVKAGNILSTVNLQAPGTPEFTVHLTHSIQFWCWLDSDVIGIVTEKSVLMWSPAEGSIAKEVFKKDPRLEFTELIEFKCDPSMQWFALTGLYPQDGSIAGVTQLYSLGGGISQVITAHTLSFINYRFHGNSESSLVMCTASRDTDATNGGSVHVIELGSSGTDALVTYKHDVTFTDELAMYDFPIHMVISSVYGLIYMLTKYGWLYVCDLETATCLCCTAVSTSVVFAAVLNTDTQGLLAINRMGQVLSIDVKSKNLIHQAEKTQDKEKIVKRLSQVLPPIDISMDEAQLKQLLQDNK